ncbi:hypothetical protein H7F50_19470 [Novosphingobium flavum]|uniref:Uncharacterized protein n=1 Tax=Novosphingobium aerophilum TaxID=2839843 RepID=A0A7X1FB02_9SPHN|nr:hypothetical protein [Novosphingobium aerophilum]MBC2653680.1 hypothetical protein [Novosphingobium aerophilum]MBC2663886.1 hypothetical protein [Novosphingobium aerophilum]
MDSSIGLPQHSSNIARWSGMAGTQLHRFKSQVSSREQLGGFRTFHLDFQVETGMAQIGLAATKEQPQHLKSAP